LIIAGDNGCGFTLFALDVAAQATKTSADTVLRKLTVNTVARQTQRDFTLGTLDIKYVKGQGSNQKVGLSSTGFFANPLTEVAAGSATGASDEEATGPKLQMSLAAQFSGTVTGSDQFQATLSQFESQEI